MRCQQAINISSVEYLHKWKQLCNFHICPLNKCQLLKERICSQGSKFFPLRVDSTFEWTPSARVTNKKSQKVSSFLYKWQKAGWLTYDNASFSTAFLYDGRLIMKGCVQWNIVYV